MGKKDSAAIDAAILRMQAAVEHFTFYCNKQKKLGTKEDQKAAIRKTVETWIKVQFAQVVNLTS